MSTAEKGDHSRTTDHVAHAVKEAGARSREDEAGAEDEVARRVEEALQLELAPSVVGAGLLVGRLG